MIAVAANSSLGAGRAVEVPGAKYYDFTSSITGHDYRLFVGIPAGEPPQHGFPVVYVLDGNSCFASVVETVRGGAMGGEIRPAVVVGIGYQTTELPALSGMRFKDLSTPAAPEWIERWMASVPVAVPGLNLQLAGDVDAFLRVIEGEIKPAVAEMVRVNSADQALMGHSLGGLAVIRALFTEPETFRTFVALSPSLWWGDNGVLTSEAAFADRVTAGGVRPRVLIGVGELEQMATSLSMQLFKSRAAAQAAAEFCKMVDNAVELGARLAKVTGGPDFVVKTVVFPDEGHLSVIPGALCRGLRFALGTEDGTPPAVIGSRS
jgi:predicted alpha/beta superfamily hydrolase